ncbi:Helix-turn-helix domain [Puniceibacterium sp. IMCC21224]|nr:Helix-turn-helix domain [Puniceibacterium sp. IMCC21224]
MQMMSPAQIAKTLDVSVRTVSRMCAKGEIPAHKVRHQWRVDRRDFLKWLREGKSGAWRLFTSVEIPTGSAFNGAAKKSGNRLEQLLSAKPENISRTSKSNTAG